jgi:hypothetical protein
MTPAASYSPGVTVFSDQRLANPTAHRSVRGTGGDDVSNRQIALHRPSDDREDAEINADRQGIMRGMPAQLAPADPARSYASPARQRGYIDAMRRLAAGREPGGPVRVYVSAPPMVAERTTWADRLRAVRRPLPAGVQLVTFPDLFSSSAHYYEAWEEVAATLDGLIIVALKKKQRGRVYLLGPGIRKELITFVGAGKPVLLSSSKNGLVPVIDCQPRRVGPDQRPQTKLAVPNGWTRNTPGPTLAAALAALQPKLTAEEGRQFAASTRA